MTQLQNAEPNNLAPNAGVAIPGQSEALPPEAPPSLFDAINERLAEQSLSAETLTEPEQERFTTVVQGSLHAHFKALHDSRWEKEQPTAPPLAKAFMERQVAKYYGRVQKDPRDRVIKQKLNEERREFIPVAQERSIAFPEIFETLQLWMHYRERGYIVAQDAMADLLTIYGISIVQLRKAGEQMHNGVAKVQ